VYEIGQKSEIENKIQFKISKKYGLPFC